MAVNVLVTHFGLQTSRHKIILDLIPVGKAHYWSQLTSVCITNKREIILNLIPVRGHIIGVS